MCGCNRKNGVKNVMGRRPIISPQQTQRQTPNIPKAVATAQNVVSIQSVDQGMGPTKLQQEKQRRDILLRKLGRL